MGQKILHAIVVAGGWGVLAIGALWGSVPKSHCISWSLLCSKFYLKMQSQPDSDYEEEYEGSSNDILAGEYLVAVKQDTFQFGFSSSKPGWNNKDGNLVVTVIDRSGVHEIGVRWCCCLDAPECNMQMLAAGLFPAMFWNPKTTFIFWVLEEFHLDNLECKTMPSLLRSKALKVQCAQVVQMGVAHVQGNIFWKDLVRGSAHLWWLIRIRW